MCSHTPGDSWQTYDYDSETADGPLGNISIYISDIFAQFIYNFLNIVFTCNVTQDLELDVFNIRWFIVFDKELFVLILKEDIATPQYKKFDMRQHHE